MRIQFASGMLILGALAASFTTSVAREPQASAKGAARTTQGQTRTSATAAANAGGRKIPCKSPENASLCYWIHGRLSVYEGNPTLRIWKIGTYRILGVYNGPSHFPPRTAADDENPELPAHLDHAYLVDRRRWEKKGNTGYGPPDIFADFEVCLLEPEREGTMQAACIESAKNILVEKRWR